MGIHIGQYLRGVNHLSAKLLARLTGGGRWSVEPRGGGKPEISTEEIMGAMGGTDWKGRRLMRPVYLVIAGIYCDDEKCRYELKAYITQHFLALMIQHHWEPPELSKRVFADLVSTLTWVQHWGGYKCPYCQGVDLKDTCKNCGGRLMKCWTPFGQNKLRRELFAYLR